MLKYYLGIDPGKVNLGLSLLGYDINDKTIDLIYSRVFIPNSYKTVLEFIRELDRILKEYSDGTLSGVGIERFVPFGDVFTKDAEFIVQLIGSLVFYFLREWDIGPVMMRSVEWKQNLVKHLFKTQGFDNPSTSLDKKFSEAAAKACLDKNAPTFTENHTADAICLAYMAFLKDQKK